MKRVAFTLIGFGMLLIIGSVHASGPVGTYAVIEKVVFEPDEANAERVQIWGAFTFMDGGITANGATTTPQKGYLYFMMPPDASEATRKIVRTEWADLKSLAGTGQGVAFGRWGYIGAFGANGLNEIYVTVQVGPNSFRGVQLVVRNSTPPFAPPTPYITNTGLVKLSPEGSHAEIVKRLRDALKKPF